MKLPKPAIAWSLLTNAIEIALVVSATTTNATGPSNIVKFLAGTGVVMGLIFLCALANVNSIDNRPNWIKQLLILSDLVNVSILAWHGWFWCASGFAFSAVGSSIYRARKPKDPTP